jgi:hypothetical protein
MRSPFASLAKLNRKAAERDTAALLQRRKTQNRHKLGEPQKLELDGNWHLHNSTLHDRYCGCQLSSVAHPPGTADRRARSIE